MRNTRQPTDSPPPRLAIRLICEDLPPGRFKGCDGRRNIRVDLQTKDGLVAGTPAGRDALAWTTQVTVKRGADGTADFAGPAVHGKRGERFFYLSWSGERDGRREMFRRAKVHLRDVTSTQVAKALKAGGMLTARVHAVAKDGGPACASVPIAGGWLHVAHV
ncbi:MAG TPA: DUF5990 family protein [Verrucomicrobiota bacterium]|nr:DUF5990 family protein [Verrucomicrobiota bacterium]